MERKKNAEEFRVIRDRDRPPLFSPVTAQVALALAMGFRFRDQDGECKSFLDATEATADGPKREVSWTLSNAGSMTFRPIPRAEKLSLVEALERAGNIQWLEKNPDHPITLAVAAMTQLLNLQRKMTLPPDAPVDPVSGGPLIRHDLIRKGKSRFYVPRHLPREEKEMLMREFKF